MKNKEIMSIEWRDKKVGSLKAIRRFKQSQFQITFTGIQCRIIRHLIPDLRSWWSWPLSWTNWHSSQNANPRTTSFGQLLLASGSQWYLQHLSQFLPPTPKKISTYQEASKVPSNGSFYTISTLLHPIDDQKPKSFFRYIWQKRYGTTPTSSKIGLLHR